MNISNSQVNRLRHFVRAGLRSLFRPEPQTAVEWADASYYLPKESAYQEGRWETLPFQRAIMNAMGSDYIREVNVVKSARVGYSKMLLGVYAYFIEHKQRNTLIWLPTDGDAENFMKTHVEPTIRDIPSLLALAPWYGKKHRDNTLTMKRFTNGRGFWCLGGKAAKNYREKSVDVAGYDELAAFDEDIEQEGSPTFLGDKRIEGSVWPKSIRGSTPKVRGTCQIERAASESPHFMRFHVACPHCGEEQYLKFGDKETPFGLKWTPDDPSSVFYLCEHNACVIRQQELDFTDARYICEKTGIWTRDGILWFSSSGEEIEPPDSVTFHIWTAYSPFTTWVQIVKDWMKTKGDTGKRKTFVNTTLGETWEAKIGERPDAEVMAERKEHYSAPVPDRVAYLTAGIDSQLDRYEMRVWGWGPGEESWLIDRQIIMGRHDDEQTLLRVDEAINKTYTRRNGAEMSVSRICWDTGGIDPTIVYERSKKHGLFRVIPIKGASVYGKPVASMPRKRNKNGVYLTEIGTDIASMAFNEPLMLEPAYARVFFCALAGQLGISRLTDAVSGDSLTAGEAPATLALVGDGDGPRQARSYQVMNGIAVLPVSGTLVSRTRALQPYSGMTGYNGIIARLQQAASDPMVDGILLDMDTPGGMVAGTFDCADIIARVRDIKPVWALANDMNCSAGQLLASAASRRLVTQTARTGSIGVMMYGAALEKQGVEITLIYSGSHKVDGNPYSHLPDDVRETLQSRMDATRQMFAQKVSAYTGLSVQAVLDTEAAVYSGQEAIDAGLADELVNSTDAITVMRDALDARKSRLSGGRMTKETQSTTVSATASQADVTDVVPATEGENASAAQPDVNAQITAAVAAENSRIMGILNCEEAHGREEQARVLAETPGMTVETARRILAAAPQSAQARSDTALDRLMQGAPAPLAAGNPASDAVNDLLNTPV